MLIKVLSSSEQGGKIMSSFFNGFSQQTLDFLRELELNNNKAWFESHRHIYKEFVVQPMECLAMDLSAAILEIDPLLVTEPRRTLSRINRDMRFSKDKSPYRKNVWLTFKRYSEDWMDKPGFYFEIGPYAYRYGMGYYNASRETMDKLRWIIDHKPARFFEAIDFYREGQPFVVEGDTYKRILNPAHDQSILTWYQRKNLYLACNRKPDDRLFSRDLAEDVADGFRLVRDFYYFLLEL